MNFSTDAVRALSPDDASFKAARGLVAIRQWPSLGRNDEALWGECQGSGSKPYQTQIDVRAEAPSFRCSCPSRKFPCKHGLALLLIAAEQTAALTANNAPAWVTEWLSARSERAEKKEQKQREAPEAPADPHARQRREAKRLDGIRAATTDLSRWLSDGVARGFGQIAKPAEIEQMAARLVDAKAPGLAVRLRELATLVREAPSDWLARALAQMAELQLACDALERRDALSPELRAELDYALGLIPDRAEVLSSGESVDDHWSVLGQRFTELDERLTERRVWLHGANSRRFAYVLDHRFATTPFERHYVIGSGFEGSLVFYPGHGRLRALVGEIRAVAAARKPHGDVASGLAALGKRLARTPWTWWQPLWLNGARLARNGRAWLAQVDGREFALELNDSIALELAACTAGARFDLFVEWRGQGFVPLCAEGLEGLWQWSGA